MRLNAKVCGLIFAAVSLSSLPLFVQADDKDAMGMLSRMSAAMESLNYEGTFVQVRNGQTNLMHILHASDEHGKSERMRSLNGTARELIRSNSTVTSILPGDNMYMASDNYQVSQIAEGRVAGIETDIVDVLPADDFRYGYRFWIDQETGMMLRSMVLDADNQPLEEVMFTSIEYLDAVDPARFNDDVNRENTQRVESKTDAAKVDGSKPEVDKVSFEDLPKGFEERSETLRMVAVSEDAPISHLVVSDGFSMVSVYVEYTAREKHDPSSLGLTHMGAINAFGLSLPDALVTVVGEAPGKTVEMIARAARLVN